MFGSINPVLLGVLVVATAVISWLLSALFLRSACDLTSVEAPGFLKALVLVLVHFLVTLAISAFFVFGLTFAASAAGASTDLALVMAAILALLVSALAGAGFYVPTLRVRFVRAITITGWFYFISAVVYGVMFLLLIGGITTIEGLRRLT